MATFVRTTASPLVRNFVSGLRQDLARHPHAAALLATFAMVCVHAATYTPM